MRRQGATVRFGRLGIGALAGIVVLGLVSSPVAVAAAGASPSTGRVPPPTHPVHFPNAPARLTGQSAPVQAAVQAAAHRVDVTAHLTHLESALQPELGSATPVEVDIRGDVSRAAAAVRAAGGQVRAQVAGAMTAVVAGTKLAGIAATAGITLVSRPQRPIEQATTSQGVALSNAAAWHTAGVTGSGVKIAIIDASFGSLPAGIATQETDYCMTPKGDVHGSAVTEIVHQMAPAAQLYLYCVDTSVEVNTAEQAIRALGDVKIITSSLGWPGDSRGDGTGDTGSVADAVRDARQHGILWINSAGNQAQDHWSGSMVDANGDSLVDLSGPAEETDSVLVGPGGPGSVVLSWDQWPTSNLDVRLILIPYQCQDASCATYVPLYGTDSQGNAIAAVVQQSPGTSPTLGADISNKSSQPQVWVASIAVPSSQPSIRYDLTWGGDISTSDLATRVSPARGAAGSVDVVASSPYAMAIGAADGSGTNACQSDSGSVGGVPFEAFSSQGPTIDGRNKPDLVAYDGTDSNVYGSAFCGTSASAPHVAGAAALAAQANPGLDASQLEYFLEQQADQSSPINPANSVVGHGVLTLGPPNGAPAPVGSTYTSLSAPVRVLDTRIGTGRPGGARGPIPSGQSIAVAIAPNVPSGATAISVNVTGLLPPGAGASFLGVFPGGASWPGTSNVNLSQPNDTVGAASTIVPIGPGGVVQVQTGRVSADALLDVTGYFTAGTGGQKYTALSSPVRTYNGLVGNHVLNSGQSVVVHPNVPSGTTAVLINLTAASPGGLGFFNVSPTASVTSSALNYRGGIARANMAIVGLNSSGSFVISARGVGAIPIVDLNGYFSAGGASSFVPLASPVRIMDTRTGNGGRKSLIGGQSTTNLFVAGLNGVPYSAAAVVTGVTVIDYAGSTYLTAFRASTAVPFASTLNATAGRAVPNGAVVGIGADQVAFYNKAGVIDLVSDLFGYFR